jgi:hypothetical protein
MGVVGLTERGEKRWVRGWVWGGVGWVVGREGCSPLLVRPRVAHALARGQQQLQQPHLHAPWCVVFCYVLFCFVVSRCVFNLVG